MIHGDHAEICDHTRYFFKRRGSSLLGTLTPSGLVGDKNNFPCSTRVRRAEYAILLVAEWVWRVECGILLVGQLLTFPVSQWGTLNPSAYVLNVTSSLMGRRTVKLFQHTVSCSGQADVPGRPRGRTSKPTLPYKWLLSIGVLFLQTEIQQTEIQLPKSVFFMNLTKESESI